MSHHSVSRNATRTRLRTCVATGVCVLGLAAIGYASTPHTFAPSETLTAANLNNNFTSLDTRVTALENSATAIPTVTNWASYTPAVSPGAVGALATQTSKAFWRRVGDTIEINIDTMFSACSSPGALAWTLPQGVVPDANKLAMTNMLVGNGMFYGSAGIRGLYVMAQGGSPFVVPDITTGPGGGIKCADVGAGNVEARLMFSLPVAGW